MKKILLVSIILAVGAQCVYADIVPGGCNLDVSAGVNAPISYSESGFPGGGIMNDSASPGATVNLALLFGTSQNNELGVGFGVTALSVNPTSEYQKFEEENFSNTSNSTFGLIPVYFEDKYVFQSNSMKPFILGRVGITTNPSSNSLNVISNGTNIASVTQNYNSGVYLGAGAGVYLTNNVFLEADLNYYQLSCEMDENNILGFPQYHGKDTIGIVTTGVQLGYAF